MKRKGTKGGSTGGRVARPPRTGAPVGEHPADGAVSDPQEVDLFPAREGHPWEASAVDRGVRDLRDLLDDGDRSWARWAWRAGDKAYELYNGLPERTKHHATFRAFMLASFDLTYTDYYELLRIRARLTSAEAAHDIGREKLRLGFRLLDQKGLVTFETLAEKDLPLLDGETCRWPSATVRELRAALKLLKAEDAAPAPSRRLVSEATRLNEAYALARQDDDDLADLRVKFYAEGGEVLLDAPPMTKVQRLALARFVRRVES